MCSFSLSGVEHTDIQLVDNGEDELDIIYTLSANINDAFFEVNNAVSSRNISFSKNVQ